MKQKRQDKKRYPRDARKIQVLEILLSWGGQRALTQTQLAFWLNMKPSTHLLGILYDMWEESLLDCEQFVHRPGKTAHLWSATHEGELLLLSRYGKVRIDTGDSYEF